MGFVGMAKEDMGFPDLGDYINTRYQESMSTSADHFRSRQYGTYIEESCVFPFFHALFNQLQGLLQVLAVNGILDLLVAPVEYGVTGGHGGEEGTAIPIEWHGARFMGTDLM